MPLMFVEKDCKTVVSVRDWQLYERWIALLKVLGIWYTEYPNVLYY